MVTYVICIQARIDKKRKIRHVNPLDFIITTKHLFYDFLCEMGEDIKQVFMNIHINILYMSERNNTAERETSLD